MPNKRRDKLLVQTSSSSPGVVVARDAPRGAAISNVNSNVIANVKCNEVRHVNANVSKDLARAGPSMKSVESQHI